MKPIALAVVISWVLAFLVWTGTASPYVPIVASGLAPLALLRLRRNSLSTHASIFALLGVAVLLICFRLAWPGAANTTEGVFPVTITSPLAEYLLLVQAFVLLCQRVPEGLWKFLPTLELLTLFCAFNRRILPAEHPFYLVLAIATVCGCAALSSVISLRYRPARSWYRGALTAAFLCLFAVCTWGVSSVLLAAVPQAQMLLPLWMARSETTTNKNRGYVRTGTLSSILTEQQTDPMKVALRVEASTTPGYMRGLVYDTYHCEVYNNRFHSRWRVSDRPDRLHVVRRLDNVPTFLAAPGERRNVFAIRGSARPPFAEMEIQNDPTRGKMFFTPLSVDFLEGAGRFLVIDEHQVVYGDIRQSEPYTVYAGGDAEPATCTDGFRARLLTLPEHLNPQVELMAADACQRAQTPRQKIDAVVSLLQNRFEYAVERVELPRDVEPISYFLLNRMPAHCEFFASGAVMLLRHQGVPCRYVTGYVVAELDEEGGTSWLARNQNAHAWAEAYDDDRERWVVVEATPGMSLNRDVIPADEEESETRQGGVADGGEETDELDEGWLASAWTLLTRMKYQFLAVGVVLWVTVSRVRSWNRLPPGVDQGVARMQRLLARLEKRLRRQRLERHPQETLHDFAHRLQRTNPNDKRLQQCAAWYLEYAALRYAGKAAGTTSELPPLPL